MRDLSELNLNEGGGPVKRPPPSPGTIAAFEREFGVTLPADYLGLLRFSNGGHPELDVPTLSDGSLSDSSVNRFHHLDEDRGSTESLWRATRDWRAVLGEKKIPFAGDGTGNVFVLDLGQEPATVSICLHEEGFELEPLAPSFAAFIDSLDLDPDLEEDFDEDEA
ncbi:SMI1/KNR4 family protein [Labrys wisconsinensis]|uniref:Cell wall assembly regulator SMI1 n=1 Tax=Labrys wisconsinensis TaxID=425677 RepID=A0ABU0J9D1_9HYPH|nr:SMI1/KNR4 family protein [Labrys wisconsinensis]MDQ0469772.1 cell wall assembly regulator SMI1 [Labrys wisconsinensis]